MEQSIKSRIYPMVFGKIIKRECLEIYDAAELKVILRQTGQEYRQIVSRIPEMGGKANAYIDNMYFGAYLIAFYKNIRDKVPLEQFSGIINAVLKKKLTNSKKNPLSPEEIQKRIDGASWARQNKDRYPWTWQLEVKQNIKQGGIYFEFTNCGLCRLCGAEGVPEFTKVFCETDYLTYGTGGCFLTRTKTLADGDDCCDFWVRKMN